jgi:hypothetical protein
MALSNFKLAEEVGVPIFLQKNENNKMSNASSNEFDFIKAEVEKFFVNKDYQYYISIENQYFNIKYNQFQELDALSLIKLPILLAAYDKRDKGELDFNQIVSKYGYYGTLSDAIYDMTVYSSNEATGAVLSVLPTMDINNYIQKIIPGTKMYLDHTPAYAGIGDESYNQENIIVAEDSTKLIKFFNESKLFDQKTTDEIKEILAQSQDYFGVSEFIEGATLYLKPGYYPGTHYAIMGIVNSQKFGDIYMTIYFTSEEGLESEEISAFMALFR